MQILKLTRLLIIEKNLLIQLTIFEKKDFISVLDLKKKFDFNSKISIMLKKDL